LLSLDKAWTWDKSKKLPLHKTIGASQTLKLETCVPNKNLTGSSIYYDCQNINPERLTLGVLKSAMTLGTKSANYAKVKSFIINDKKVSGVNVVDLISHKEYSFTADLTINCTGPWTDIVLNSANSEIKNGHHIRRSEGIHVITKKLCYKHAITIMTKDGRHVMIMPWRNHTLIGTTDKMYNGTPDDYSVSRESIEGLIREINENYGYEKLKYSDILFAYGGLRPLVDDQTKETYETSRKYEIFDNAKEGLDGLITVEGGKYTTSRKLANQTLKIVSKKLNRNLGFSITNKRYLVDSDIKSMESFIKQLVLRYPQFSEATINYIGRNYGLQCHTIFRLAMYDKPLAKVLNDDGEILAEVVYVIKKEMAYTLSDIFFRRTGLGTLGFPNGETFNIVVKTAKDLLKWDDTRTQEEVDKVMKIFNLPK
jgi:glycerol-3-phosphate dehydrogenase